MHICDAYVSKDQVWVVVVHPQPTFPAKRVILYRVVHPLKDWEWEGDSTHCQVGVQLLLVHGGREVVCQAIGNCRLPIGPPGYPL